MMCEVMPVQPEPDDNHRHHTQVEELRQQVEQLNSQNRELKQLIHKLREENAELLRKASVAQMEGTANTGAPPPPPPPPVGLISPPLAQIIKQRRSGPKKPNGEIKKDENDSKQGQLIMEVVNFLKNGGLTKSKRQRSMTQPDLSADLARFKENKLEKKLETKDAAVDRFRSLKKHTERGESLTKEVDALNTSFKENVFPLDAALPTPSFNRLGSYSKKNLPELNNQSSAQGQAEKNNCSVLDTRYGLKSSLRDEPAEMGSCTLTKAGTLATSNFDSPSEFFRTSRRNSIHQSYSANNYVTENSNNLAGFVEVQEAHITFEKNRSSLNSDINMRAPSRSSRIASSFLSEAEHRDEEVRAAEMSACSSPKIIVTPADDITNPTDAIFRTNDTFIANEVSKSVNSQPEEGTQQNRVVSMLPLNESQKLVTGNNLRLPPATAESTSPRSTKDKQRFWEQAVTISLGTLKNGTSVKSASSESRSPTLEKFRDVARTTGTRSGDVKLNTTCSQSKNGRLITLASSSGAMKTSRSSASQPNSATSFNASAPSVGISRRAAANMNKFRT
ncbi:uncharacterized protein LOC111271199 [Varroa jacobsoni]|uniref:uncharacterized protein LOC111271199 n=1 Tax=Varroa jacobsoni TaxID=62625 RepID=UPI000BF49444|nr:uncharacterized protein LOC111271199 [Varroa jacobsoni]XP_022707585.1 uncharacterized protein LOC111271199 [Varroa jacobsoni]XP_022707586.1 uncharacterized protein LOC111271199 [Varroa jacobsoni]XP_022707587.1 uncharacterized protein LOC111271199 [Varroa jacobsoni]XP_022707588.1 uncharacterized protein LOC111271199 [Varroa jacobsoni]XP_022707589.1 uncharacterized protein LOC111271199 [Varroa jacobsoni]XP_022707590.1 uncharacterized protein LOC111271199 [Varroa jacobsoni]